MNFAPTIVPGDREPVATVGVAAAAPAVPEGPSTMDAITTAERQREGGGAPSQRRPGRRLFGWRFRSTHV